MRSNKQQDAFRWKGFRPGPDLGAGRLTLSTGYFMQGHAVSYPLHVPSYMLNKFVLHQGKNKPLTPSGDLRMQTAQEWLSSVYETELLIGAITSVTCPDMAKKGYAALDRIAARGLTSLPPYFRWPSPFTCIELLVNRSTGLHHDTGGSWTMHDVLASFGSGHDAVFHIHELGADICFPPGSLIMLLSKMFQHSADWTIGERICVAHFMKDQVHDRVGVASPRLPRLGEYLSLVGQKPPKRRR